MIYVFLLLAVLLKKSTLWIYYENKSIVKFDKSFENLGLTLKTEESSIDWRESSIQFDTSTYLQESLNENSQSTDAKHMFYLEKSTIIRGYFWFIFISKLYSLSFAISDKKDQDQKGPYINMFQTNLRNVCLSVILAFSLSLSFVCDQLMQRPRYFLEIRYQILILKKRI